MEAAVLGDRLNMLFKGTAVTRGSAEAVVVATGMNTELGGISDLIQKAKEETTPLEKQLDYLGRKLLWVTLILIAIIAAAHPSVADFVSQSGHRRISSPCPECRQGKSRVDEKASKAVNRVDPVKTRMVFHLWLRGIDHNFGIVGLWPCI